ncbi:MAG: hypothetical protein R6U88_02740 [Candidatus Bipolaricaulota bacterium]
MRMVFMMMLGAMLWTASSAEGTPSYLWGELELPPGALDGLAARIQTESVPLAAWEEGTLEFTGVEDQQELESSNAYAYLDGDVILVSVQKDSRRGVLRGRYPNGEIVGLLNGASPSLPEGFLELAYSLGLLPELCLDLELREVPLKLPRPPEDIHLDSVLWALVNHPDWLGFARDHGLEREGLRVRVVAEVTGRLDEKFEPYIESSTETLAELLIPIPYLPALGSDPEARLVRPPHTPYPAEE